MIAQSIVRERRGAVEILRINRQHAANALAEADLEQLAGVLRSCIVDPEVRAIIAHRQRRKVFLCRRRYRRARR